MLPLSNQWFTYLCRSDTIFPVLFIGFVHYDLQMIRVLYYFYETLHIKGKTYQVSDNAKTKTSASMPEMSKGFRTP